MSFDSQKVSSFLKRAAVVAVGVAAVFTAGGVVAAPQCIYVSQSGSGTAPYDAPDKATSSIETAVAAVTEDEAVIYVAPSATSYKFDTAARLNIRSNVKIWGQTDDPTQVVIEPKTAKASPLFLLGHADAGLYNLTMQGASKGGLKGGACVKIESTGGTVSNCVMRNVYDDGSWDATAAGVYMDAGLVTHCVLTNIYASMGSSQSHGMVAYMAGGSMENCLVAQNPLGGKDSSSASGGVIALAGSSRLVNCTIAGNRMRGPAGVLIESTSAEVINCVIADNTSTQQPGTETYVGYTSGNKAINVKDCFTACVTKEDINGTCYQTDVFFKEAAAHDYHLAFNSPAVDHGVTPENYTPPATDLDRNVRIVNGTIDIGCYEYFSSGLECSFVMSAAKGMVPFGVTFTAAVSDPNPNSLTYKWDVFGDGSVIETTQTPTLVYTYTVGGTFITKLTVVKGGVDYPANNTVSFKAYPKDVYVSQSGTGTSPYDEPGKATSSIEDAVAVASDGSVIHVAASATPYKFTKAERLSIRENIVIRGPEGDPTQVVFEPKSAKASPLFLLGHADAGLYNLTMQGGCGGGVDAGDCVYIEKAGGTVSNCVMRNVSDSGAYGVRGAGVAMVAGLVTHCVLSNLVTAMTASSSHGMAAYMSGGSMENCLIAQNCGEGSTSFASCGGIVALTGDARLINCTVAGNKLNGPAGVLLESTTAKVINCVIGDNTSVLYPGTAVETYAGYSGKTAINVTNCFTACATEIYINETCYKGNLNFKDASKHDYHLALSSSARNHGVIPDGYVPPATDLDGAARMDDGEIDIGCYELHVTGISASFSASPEKEAMVPCEVTFTAVVSDPNPNTLTYKWDVFGDGSVIETTYVPKLVYTYQLGGKFTVKLTVEKDGTEYPADNTVAFNAYPKYVYMSKSGSATAPYDTLAKATTNVEDAVDAASDGSVILVAPAETPYKFSKAERLCFRKNLVIRGLTDDPAQVVFEPKSKNASPLFLLDHADSGLYNITMQGGCGGASGDSTPAGDCVYIEKAGGTVSNCVMRNVSDGGPYGVYAAGVHMVAGLVTHCVLSNLVSAMSSSSSQGMSASLTGGSMENCLITLNIGTGRTDPPSSGGIVLLSGSSRLVNCTIAGNKLNGPAGILVGSTTAKVINCVIGDNTSVLYPGTAVETYAGYSGKTAIDVTNCFTACAAETDINDTCYVGDLAFKDRAAHDYHITVDSPARNHGVIPDGYMPPATDLDGKPRIVSRKIDIGCYECKGGGFTLIVR